MYDSKSSVLPMISISLYEVLSMCNVNVSTLISVDKCLNNMFFWLFKVILNTQSLMYRIWTWKAFKGIYGLFSQCFLGVLCQLVYG